MCLISVSSRAKEGCLCLNNAQSLRLALQIMTGIHLLLGRACQKNLEFEILLGYEELEAKSKMRPQAEVWVTGTLLSLEWKRKEVGERIKEVVKFCQLCLNWYQNQQRHALERRKRYHKRDRERLTKWMMSGGWRNPFSVEQTGTQQWRKESKHCAKEGTVGRTKQTKKWLKDRCCCRVMDAHERNWWCPNTWHLRGKKIETRWVLKH